MSDRFMSTDKAKKSFVARGCAGEAGREDRKVSARMADQMEVSHLQLWMTRPLRERLAQERRERSR